MDDNHFDDLARALVADRPRRWLVKGLVGAAFGVLLRRVPEAAAAGCAGTTGCSGNAQCADCPDTFCGPAGTCCRGVGAKCKRRRQCCSGRCSKRGTCRPCSANQNTCLITERFNSFICTCEPCPKALCNGTTCCPADKPSCCGTTPPTCKASLAGGTCETDADCCFTVCDTERGKCCRPTGESCNLQSICCSGICSGGKCV